MNGVLSTSGHLASNGGLRGHSVGDCFPYIVVATGSPCALVWRVMEPNGQLTDKECKSALEASQYGRYLRDSV